jgi:methylated-DNA-[protein]-cysteine S-methyltransferase
MRRTRLKEITVVYYTLFETSLWEIVLVGDRSGLTRLHLCTDEKRPGLVIEDRWIRDDGVFAPAREQILEYLAGKRRSFSLSLNPGGTVFQNRVWEALCAIPYGEVRTYKEVATKVGNPRASRAVGMANARNPLPLVIPCHRVIGSNASLTGFAFGLEAKQRLLDLEQGR